MRSHRLASLFLAGALVQLQARVLPAQSCERTGTLTGTVRSEHGAPVPQVELSAHGGSRTLSDTAGRYRMAGVCAGASVLTSRRLGYHAGTWRIDVPEGGSQVLSVTLRAIARELEPVIVAARQQGGARLRDFYLRRQRIPGKFLTREDLEPFDHRTLSDVLRARVPGVQVGSSTGAIRNRVRIRGQRCAPMVWLDGMSTPAGEFDLDILTTSSVAALEVYSGPATTPAEFRTPFGRDGCGGVIVVWTRIGRDQWDQPRPRGRPSASVAALSTIFSADEVDVPAAVDSSAMVTPAYPDSLRAFEVSGVVVAEFVVDTAGIPVAESVKIVSASSPAFGEAVIRAISASRFIPARKDERPVPQLMTLPFRFTHDQRS